VILSPGPTLVVSLAELAHHAHLDATRQNPAVTPTRQRPVRSILTDVDRDQIIQALKDSHGQIGGPDGAASRLGLKRTTFITRMKKLGIVPSEASDSGAVGEKTLSSENPSGLQPSSEF
jgi:formate hydrogenlyase transcriptional activator